MRRTDREIADREEIGRHSAAINGMPAGLDRRGTHGYSDETLRMTAVITVEVREISGKNRGIDPGGAAGYLEENETPDLARHEKMTGMPVTRPLNPPPVSQWKSRVNSPSA